MQNSACFIGKNSFSHEQINRIKEFITYLTDKFRVKVFYLYIGQKTIYKILTEVRKTKKKFQRVLLFSKSKISADEAQNIYKFFEAFILPNKYLNIKEIKQNLISKSTYVVFLTGNNLNHTAQELYNMAKEKRKEVFVLS